MRVVTKVLSQRQLAAQVPPQLASPPSLLCPLAALLKILAVHPKLGPKIYAMPALLRRCLRDEHASADARIASALLALHAPPAAPPPPRAALDIEALFFAPIGLNNFRRLHWQRTPLHLPARDPTALCRVALPAIPTGDGAQGGRGRP